MNLPHSITLPAPPSANKAWRAVRGQVLKSREARQWMRIVLLELMALRVDRMEPQTPYAVRIVANIGHNRDIDNLAKLSLDALAQEGGATPQDQWCDRLVIERCQDRSKGAPEAGFVSISWGPWPADQVRRTAA